MSNNNLIDIAADRKLLNINDTVDDPDIKIMGEIANDDVENDISDHVDNETLTGEDLSKAIKLCTLLTASLYKNGKNNKEQSKFFMDLYEKGLDRFKARKRVRPSTARKVSTTEFTVNLLQFQRKRL